MKKKLRLLLLFVSILSLFFIPTDISAQTFSGTGGNIITLVDTSRFNINVSGLSPSAINYNSGLESVTININHPQDRDIDCFLASPDGTMIELTTDNGNTSANFTSTVFRYDIPLSITSGTAPFTGSYKPEGNLSLVNNGQNGNGTWQLRVIDDTNNGVTGSVVNWSIKFSTSPAAPFNQSNLPIVILNTNGQSIVDDPKIICDMGIIKNAGRNHVTDPYNNYNGKVAIEIRGSSSQSFPKKSYGFETRDASGNLKNDVSLAGIPAEHDWILSANYTDKSFCRNVLTYQLANEMGHYAVRTVYVDLVLNGQYQGIYVLMESIKRDSNRVDIANLHPYEVTPPDITGGYILKVDKRTGSGGSGWTSQYPPINHTNNQTTFIQYDYPSQDSIVPSQQAYIRSYVDSFENALSGTNFTDSVLGYRNFIANGSWIDYFFSDELSKNVDGYRISSYLYKDKDKKLRAGPVWDFDIAWGNANYCSGSDTTGWGYLFPCTGDGYQIPFWWQRLLQDTNYTNEMKCRWNTLRKSTLSKSHIFSIIDSVASLLDESKTWNFNKWNILGTYVWPNPSPQPATYAGEIQNLKNWVQTRLAWLDSNMPGNCNCTLTTNRLNASCNLACDGRAVAVANSPYKKTYSWNNGGDSDTLFNLCAGSYVIKFEDKIGCNKTDTVVITQPAAINISLSSTNADCSGNGCNGSSLANVSGGTGPYSYSWTGGQTNSSITSLCPGVYTLNIRDAHSCTKTSSVTITNPSAPVLSLSSKTNVSCHGGNNGQATVAATGGSGAYSYSWAPSGGTSATATNLSAGNYVATIHDTTGCSSQFNITITEPAAITFTSSVTNAVCYGSTGSANVVVHGGSSPFTYSWNQNAATIPVLSNVNAGTYNLNVTDSRACVASNTVIINQPDAFSFTPQVTPPVCNGGSNGAATVNVTGGTGTISYSWNTPVYNGNHATQLSAGQYSITVTDASNCSASSAINIIDPPKILLSSTFTTATCGVNNGTATTTASNGTAPYTYAWFPSGSANAHATNLNAGINTVVVTDANGCTANDTVNIASASGLVVQAAGRTSVSCNGATDAAPQLVVSGGSGPYTYAWLPSGGTNSSATNLSPGIYSVSIHESNGCATSYQLNISEPPVLSVIISSTAADCAGEASGSAIADVTGGTPDYTFSWSSSDTSRQINNIHAGNYNVTVTDINGCTASSSANVGEPTAVIISTTETSAQCGFANGASVAHVTGGGGNYSYLWSNGDLDPVNDMLFSGNYSLTVTDSAGCHGVANIFIPGTTAPLIDSVISTAVTCSGNQNATAQLFVTGGTGTLNYLLNNSASPSIATNLSAGIYSAIVTDSLGCTDSTGFIIDEPAPLAALISTTTVKCYGGSDGSIYADAGGGTPPYSYAWSNSDVNDTAMNLAPGNYSVIISDANNCTASASGNVSEADSLHIEFNIINGVCDSCSNGIIAAVISGGATPYSYDWQLLSSNNDTIYNLQSGTYTLCVTDANNCIKCSDVNLNFVSTAIRELPSASGLYVYPNPVGGTAVFAFKLNSPQQVLLQVYSASGSLLRTLADEKLNAGEQLIRFDAEGLAAGIYFYRFVVDRFVQTGSLVKY